MTTRRSVSLRPRLRKRPASETALVLEYFEDALARRL